jgi:hypothetical protein
MRSYSLRVAVALGGIAALMAVAGLAVRLPDISAIVVPGLLSSQAFTAYFLLGKIEQLQAAIDMKKIALGDPVE